VHDNNYEYITFVGIGKTTLANEICIKWARDMFLHEDFTIVILIALRTVQQRSLEEVMIEQIGSEAHQELIKTSGESCLIILEGLDEMSAECQQSDPLLVKLIKFIAFIKAVLLITSRPHGCQELNANRRIEIVGFGEEQIKTFVKQSFLSDCQLSDTFIQQLMEYPHIYSLCYVPVSLVMIIDIFKYRQHSLPSTLTELYYQFIVMMLVRERVKVKEKNELSLAVPLTNSIKEILHQALPDIPKEKLENIFSLSKMAFHAFFTQDNQSNKKFKTINPKIIFIQNDFIQCGIVSTDNYDGHSLLMMETLHHFAGSQKTFNFIHLTVQEFLCAVYMLTLSEVEQYHLLQDYYNSYPDIMILYCGLTRLDFREVVYSKLTSSTMTAVKCLYEGQWNTAPHKSTFPFVLDIKFITFLPYDALSLSYACCHYPVTQLNLFECYIGDKNVEILARWCLNKNKTTKLQELSLHGNKLTSEGMKHVIKIVTSEPVSCCLYALARGT